MEVETASEEDLKRFVASARREGWRVPESELDLYAEDLAGCAFVLREEGECFGFVTAVDYGRTGWIGNLLVPDEYRGRGLGGRLFDHAVDVLRSRGAEDLWLTASEAGRPLYERRGFRSVGRVARWTHCGRGNPPPYGPGSQGEALVGRMDEKVWGDSRRKLLAPLCRKGRVLSSGSTAALLQSGEGERVLGPWFSDSACPRENREVLSGALEACSPSEELLVDVLSFSPCAVLPELAGFSFHGENALMVFGGKGRVDSGSLVALASLGSIG